MRPISITYTVTLLIWTVLITIIAGGQSVSTGPIHRCREPAGVSAHEYEYADLTAQTNDKTDHY